MDENGTGFDLQMMVSYLEFKDMITSYVDDILQEIKVSIADFGERLSAIDDDSALSLLDLLEKAHNFIEFAVMMEVQYHKLYETNSGLPTDAKALPPPSTQICQCCVRVLWVSSLSLSV